MNGRRHFKRRWTRHIERQARHFEQQLRHFEQQARHFERPAFFFFIRRLKKQQHFVSDSCSGSFVFVMGALERSCVAPSSSRDRLVDPRTTCTLGCLLSPNLPAPIISIPEGLDSDQAGVPLPSVLPVL